MAIRDGKPVTAASLAQRVVDLAERAKACPERSRTPGQPETPWPAPFPAERNCGRIPLGLALVQGSSIQPKPIRWLWPGWLAKGKLHVIAGQPGTGKTSIALALAATVTAGGCWPDGTGTDPGNVLVWSGEDDFHDTLAPRLLASGADLGRCFFVGDMQAHDGRRPFDPAQDMPALARAAREVGDIRLIVVDPIVAAIAGDSHKNAETRRGLAPLVELAARLDCALLGISHFSKGSAGRDPLERVTGSLAFGALARIVFAAFKQSKDDGGGRCFCRVKSNIGPDDGGFAYDLSIEDLADHPGVTASHVAWGNAVEGSARALLARAEASGSLDEISALEEACAFLVELLADGPVTAKTVKQEAEDAGISERTLKRARKKLALSVTKTGMEGGWVWSI
ncbi:AAA family ATPase [Methylococcus mesophilus]|uniref:AAA family ATPase n=1 Tax=Methylococcus mesophilus TaxID=2993564 RepID=UPI00224B8F45|nr:AAA family ATPase [Methylococcus mesophilus]UZR29476.1 AAA family ATPase [Methylococcus mesophilus]